MNVPLKPNIVVRYTSCVLVFLLSSASLLVWGDDFFGEVRDEPGFHLFFNGTDLTGWDGLPNCWTVRDGATWSTGRSKEQDHGKGTVAGFRNIPIKFTDAEKQESGGIAKLPDVVFIMIDDLRPMLGCYGDQHIHTPNIDRLARRGVVFDRAYCQYAKCGPSRLSIMTGLRPDSIGVYDHREREVAQFRDRHSESVSIAKWFGDHGYRTRSFGKVDHDGWHVDDDWSEPPSPGREQEMLEIVDPNQPAGPTIIADRFNCPAWQDPNVEDDHLFAGRMTNQVIEVVNSRDPDQPMFLAVGFRRPHLPFVAPRRFFDLYQPDESWLAKNPEPAVHSPVLAWFNSDGYAGAIKKQGFTLSKDVSHHEARKFNGYELRSYLGVPIHDEIPSQVQLQIIHAYAACISYVDSQVGRLLDAIERSPRGGRTIIALCSDHGWHLGEQGAWSKMTNFEVATRVPLIIAAPQVKAGRTSMLSELVDLYPTLCELAGVPLPSHLEGESLADEMRRPGKTTQQNVALSQFARNREQYMGRALRSDRFRYVQWIESRTGQIVDLELYDHQTDPNETVNVAKHAEYEGDLKRMEQWLSELQTKVSSQ